MFLYSKLLVIWYLSIQNYPQNTNNFKENLPYLYGYSKPNVQHADVHFALWWFSQQPLVALPVILFAVAITIENS
jgi:hypothetical protein